MNFSGSWTTSRHGEAARLGEGAGGEYQPDVSVLRPCLAGKSAQPSAVPMRLLRL